MQSLQARVDSFHKTRRVKRIPGKSTVALKWPHPPDFKANPLSLAEAGFFFSPSWHDRDSVACFLCRKELSDWDPDDDPFQIHYEKCRDACPWAVVRCGLADDLDGDGRFVFADKARLPSSKAMEKARLDTFGTGWWPHDDDPGHGATSIKMAQAGFVYTPQDAGDDTVTCLYCSLALGGWEKEDDPVQEHRNRDTNCPFLALSSRQTRSRLAQSTGPAKKPPADKADRQSEDELAVVEIADPPPPRPKRGKARSTASTAAPKSRRKTRTTRGRAAKASAPPRRSPSPSHSASHEADEAAAPDEPMDVDDPVPQDDPDPLDKESRQDVLPDGLNSSIHSIPDLPMPPPAPSLPPRSDTPPPETPLSRPNPIISLSPTGQPTVAHTRVLTQDERAMTLEQWIRHEIDQSHERLLTDGKRQIELFKTKAVELRKCIDQL